MPNPSEVTGNQAQCTVDERWHETTVIVSCAGEIDMLTAPILERGVEIALQRGPAAMIVDLTHVDFLASCGMGVLMTAHEACSPAVQFAVVADSAMTSRPMRLIGLTDIIDVHATLDDALASVRVARDTASPSA
jgi:anti-anti-sigma factor